jgi:hypothetical protein
MITEIHQPIKKAIEKLQSPKVPIAKRKLHAHPYNGTNNTKRTKGVMNHIKKVQNIKCFTSDYPPIFLGYIYQMH